MVNYNTYNKKKKNKKKQIIRYNTDNIDEWKRKNNIMLNKICTNIMFILIFKFKNVIVSMCLYYIIFVSIV